MNYRNAKKGIDQIYKAELLAILGTVLLIVGAIVVLVAGNKGSEGGMVAGGIPALIGGILLIISYLINLVGLSNASKDDEYFKTAWIIALVTIVASAIQAVLNTKGLGIEWLFDLISRVGQVAIMVFVITGIGRIADKLGNSNVSRLSKNTINVTCGVYVLALIANLISDIFNAKAMMTVAAVIAIIAGILSIISYIYYLRTLSQANQMFD